MFFPNRRLALGYLMLLLPPLVLTGLAFVTLATLDETEMVVGVQLDAMSYPTPDSLVVNPRVHDSLTQAQTLLQTGLTAQAQGDHVAAEEAYRAALALAPTLAPAYAALGSLYVTLERPAEALVMYQQAADLEPHTAAWQRSLGVIQANLGDLAGAVAALEAAVRLEPENASYYFELGQVYAYWQRPTPARQAFYRALVLHPDAEMVIAVVEQLRLLPAE